MGKASRRKKIAQKDSPVEREVRRFIATIGPVRASGDDFWTLLGHRFGMAYADELLDLVRSREGDLSVSPWELLWASPDTALGTFLLSAPWAREWMTHWSLTASPAGDVLDLGSGSGILTCFYARQRPLAQVIGVELSPRGVETGQAIAARFGISNVSFVQGDVTELNLGRRFGVVVSTTLRQELGWLPEGRFVSAPSDEKAASGERTPGRRLASTVADHLLPSGQFLSFERCSDGTELLEWLGDLSAAGLALRTDSSRFLNFRSLGLQERMPALDVGFGPRLPLTELGRWAVSNRLEGVGDEVAIATSSPELLAGFHADVNDATGSGATRVYLLRVGSEFVLWQTTTRGFRRLIASDEKPGALQDTLLQMQSAFLASSEVVEMRALDTEDLDEIVLPWLGGNDTQSFARN